MTKIFTLRMRFYSISDFEESITVNVTPETWKSLRKIIKNFLEEKDYL